MTDGAAILIIGNEILSGKVQDTNSPYLVAELRSLGFPVERILVVPDETTVVAGAVAEFSASFSQVFTSGGVGPTLDDVTFEGIAAAFGLKLLQNASLEQIIRDHYGNQVTESHLKMALLPADSQLTWTDELPWPHIEVRNVMVLPGDPVILRKKFSAIKERFRRRPWHLKRVYTRLDEGDLAPLLDTLQADHATVAIGSYPVYKNPEYQVQITLESKDEELVERAFEQFCGMLDSHDIVRTE